MKRILLTLFLCALPAFAQNARFDVSFPSISSQYPTPFLVANIPPNSPVLAVCQTPANGTPCTNYATTYTSTGTACPNGSQDTPNPQPSACQSTGDAQGNIGFWAPAGKYDYTVCVATECFGPYTITLATGSAGATVFADTIEGADASIKMKTCINQVIALGGGTCNAQGLTGSQMLSQEVDDGNTAGVPVNLILPNKASWQVTETDGVSCGIKVFNHSTITGSSPGGNSDIQIVPASAAVSMDSEVCTDLEWQGLSSGVGGSYVRMDGFGLLNTVGATFTNGLLHVQDVFDNSVFSNIFIANYSGIGLYTNGACCGTSWDNVTVNGNGQTGAQPVYIHGTNQHGVFGVGFNSLSADHADPALNNILIDGGPFTGNIDFNHLYVEGVLTGGTTTPFMEISAEWGGINIFGGYIHPESSGTTAYCVDIASGTVNYVAFHGLRCSGASDTNAINDHQRGKTIPADATTGVVPPYVVNNGGMNIYGADVAANTFTSTVTTGTAPFTVTSTTPVAHLSAGPTAYSTSGTQQTNTHVVFGTCTLGTNCSLSLSGSAAFTSSSSYVCSAVDQTAANAVRVNQTAGNAFAITGTGTDIIGFNCTGN